MTNVVMQRKWCCKTGSYIIKEEFGFQSTGWFDFITKQTVTIPPSVIINIKLYFNFKYSDTVNLKIISHIYNEA